ncbi:MAG: PEP-CTERM sorting domain-containing protein [Rivularia sp. (in: cyanobacteria)]
MKLINIGIASILATLAGFAIATNPAKAAVIDFESGFSDRQSVGTVTGSDGNQATFSVGRNVNNRSNAEIAQKGNPRTAFFPRDGARTSYSNLIGDFILTNGEGNRDNYFIQFSTPVRNFSFDFLDLSQNRNSTLRAFSDSNFTNIIDQITITGSSSRGNSALDTVALNNLGSASSFSISSRDASTAIDNINYDTVPEPFTIFGTLVAAGFGVAMKRKRQSA